MKNDFLLGFLIAFVIFIFFYALHKVAFPDREPLTVYYYNGKEYILTK
jgi:hypothetical protein